MGLWATAAASAPDPDPTARDSTGTTRPPGGLWGTFGDQPKS